MKRACVRVINKFSPILRSERNQFRRFIENEGVVQSLVEKVRGCAVLTS